MSDTPDTSVTDSEKKKFRGFGSGKQGLASQAYGETAAGAVIPFKVVDDGSGLGKISVALE